MFPAPGRGSKTADRADNALDLMCAALSDGDYFDAHQALTVDEVYAIWTAEGERRGYEMR